MSELPVRESARLAEARVRAAERLRRQRDTLRPLGVAAVVAVVVSAVEGHPVPGLHGRGLGVTVALCVFGLALLRAVGPGFTSYPDAWQAAIIASMGAAGVALTALQPRGATGLAGGAAVWMAVARLPEVPGVGLGAAIGAALVVAAALAGDTAAAVIATALLCALVGVVAFFVRQARGGQSRTELLLAELEDAREEQLQAAALAERSRIASELHDVLAHSLSGAAIQLQGARMLAEREQAGDQVRTAIDRASDLVRDGLASARQAVGALRGDIPGVAQLGALVEGFRADMHVDATLTVEGDARALSAEAGLALYRGAQEALTNVARYAPGATTTVLLRYGDGFTALQVENSAGNSTAPGLQGVGGGRGLSGLRERVERVGGTLHAGPVGDGWRVEVDVPA